MSLSDAIVGGDDHGDLRGDANRLVDIGRVVVILFLRIVERQCRDSGAQHIHWQSMAWRRTQQRDDGCIELALFRQAIMELAKFNTSGQFAEPQQVTRFLEIRLMSEFVDINAAIGEDAAISVDVTNLGGGGDYALKSFGGIVCGHAGHGFLASIAKLPVADHASGTRERNLFLYLKRGQVSNQRE